MSAVGAIVFRRRYWKCTCGSDGAYAVDELLGVDGLRYTKTVQKHCCRLAAETAFASTSEHLHEMLGVDLCPGQHAGRRLERPENRRVFQA
jgi:hypothetical protein